MRTVALFCVLSCATLAGVEISAVRRVVSTLDQNGDGRPDIWRHFDARGQVTEVDVDSNFDGKPDIHEFYDRGALVRRESDRNFNGQADLVEEFDAETHGQTRSVVDIDFDGTADLLVLFQDGRPVYSKRASRPAESAAPAPMREDETSPLAPLLDPFESDFAVRAVPVTTVGACAGLTTSGGLPLAPLELAGPPSPSARVISTLVSHRPRALFLLRPTRAPPVV